MKIALYVDDGEQQIVLTPQNEVEATILNSLHDGKRVFSIHRGSFYKCNGGWTRHGEADTSTIIVLATPEVVGDAERP